MSEYLLPATRDACGRQSGHFGPAARDRGGSTRGPPREGRRCSSRIWSWHVIAEIHSGAAAFIERPVNWPSWRATQVQRQPIWWWPAPNSSRQGNPRLMHECGSHVAASGDAPRWTPCRTQHDQAKQRRVSHSPVNWSPAPNQCRLSRRRREREERCPRRHAESFSQTIRSKCSSRYKRTGRVCAASLTGTPPARSDGDRGRRRKAETSFISAH
jgi:hypothetical protein